MFIQRVHLQNENKDVKEVLGRGLNDLNVEPTTTMTKTTKQNGDSDVRAHLRDVP